MLKNLFLFLIMILIVINLYYYFINAYFRQQKKDVISYDVLLNHFIHSVSENNYFMNYGLWDEKHDTLAEANQNLVDFVFEKTNLLNKKNKSILDVGCGYGEQDIVWRKKMDKTCKIKAVDISQEHIYHALEKNSGVNFDICDAMFIDIKYKNELFDVIISLESAFHYPNRPKFFNNVSKLLKEDGKFVITDIMLNNSRKLDIINSIFLKFFGDFMNIPEQNLICMDDWYSQLNKDFVVCEKYDITESTFVPYYTYFMNEYVKNKGLPTCVGDYLVSFFCSVQPFSYQVVVCEKIMKNNEK